MIDSEKIIYLQLEKTGCTHIARLLSESVGGKQVKKHNPLDDFQQTDKLIIGSVRNPWDWYVSLWAFATKGDEKIYKNVTQKSLKNALKTYSGTEDFGNFKKWFSQSPVSRGLSIAINSFHGLYYELNKPTDLWLESYEDSHDPFKFRLWLKLIMNKRRAKDLGIGYGQSELSEFAGLMTYRYCRLYIKNFLLESKNYTINTLSQLVDFDKKLNILDDIIKMESLESDFLRIVEKAGYNPADEQIKKVIEKPKTNASKRFETSFYYDMETLQMVAEREKFLIDKYKYKPPVIRAIH